MSSHRLSVNRIVQNAGTSSREGDCIILVLSDAHKVIGVLQNGGDVVPTTRSGNNHVSQSIGLRVVGTTAEVFQARFVGPHIVDEDDGTEIPVAASDIRLRWRAWYLLCRVKCARCVLSTVEIEVCTLLRFRVPSILSNRLQVRPALLAVLRVLSKRVIVKRAAGRVVELRFGVSYKPCDLGSVVNPMKWHDSSISDKCADNGTDSAVGFRWRSRHSRGHCCKDRCGCELHICQELVLLFQSASKKVEQKVRGKYFKVLPRLLSWLTVGCDDVCASCPDPADNQHTPTVYNGRGGLRRHPRLAGIAQAKHVVPTDALLNLAMPQGTAAQSICISTTAPRFI